MGYYTYYDIEVFNKTDKFEFNLLSVMTQLDQELVQKLSEINSNGYFNDESYFTEALQFDSIKWYDHDEDMIKLSKQYPDYVFKLSGQGEDPQVQWITYYYNGKKQYCPAIITYEEFDRSILDEKED